MVGQSTSELPHRRGLHIPGGGAAQYRDVGEPPDAVAVPRDVQQHLLCLSEV